MEMHLDRSRMLAAWKLHRALEPVRNDSAVTRTDGIDIDELLSAEMDLWYVNLLLTAPEHLLVPRDLSGVAGLERTERGATVVPLPADTLRVPEVKLSSWGVPATVVLPDTPAAMRQCYPYTRATADAPVAVKCGNELRLYPAAVQGDTIESLRCIVYVPGEYEFMQSALALITNT
ncbi:MAG: hypothetical protein K2G33_08955 [Duncaniella sp.]|nr:hypothetical protein [Duncaniella sp.]